MRKQQEKEKMVNLKSVGCVIDEETLITYPVKKNGKADLNKTYYQFWLSALENILIEKNILDNSAIELLPKHAIVINTSRGSTVDDDALIYALQNNKIYAAGLDVFNNEPTLDERYLSLDNCFVLPHIGSSNYETRDAMAMLAVNNIYAYFNNKSLPSKVI